MPRVHSKTIESLQMPTFAPTFLALSPILSLALVGGCGERAADAHLPSSISSPLSELERLTARASGEEAAAQFELGRTYANGTWFPANLETAVAWYEKAAAQKHPQAMVELARSLLAGKGTVKNSARAVTLLEAAQNAGVLEATYMLGKVYEAGEGVQRDEVKALDLYRQAADTGFALAQKRMGDAYFSGKLGFKKDVKTGNLWYDKAIAQNDPRANYSIGLAFLWGRQVPPNPKKALQLMRSAADDGYLAAQSGVCRLFTNNAELTFDIKDRQSNCVKAAERGDAEAQTELATMYLSGKGIPQDEVKAADFFQRAAVQGNTIAQLELGKLYRDGVGIEADPVLAYAWLNLAGSSSDPLDELTGAIQGARQARQVLTRRMSDEDIREAQTLSSGWKTGVLLSRAAGAAGSPRGKYETGTAFVISDDGFVVTNSHVIAGCREIRAEGHPTPAALVTTDAVNDLALLKLGEHSVPPLPLAAHPEALRQGEEVVVFGYPLNAVLSHGGNLTPGVVSALTGLGNNTNQIQITAAIQPGSSGSPLLNRKGEVVGVVSMKLSDIKMVKATGQVGQNVNFAVSGQTLKTFLDRHSVRYRTGSWFTFSKETADIADLARKSSLVIECRR